MSKPKKRCYVVDKVTGRIMSEHETISDAADKLGIDRSVSVQVGKKALLASGRYTIRLVEDYDPRESFADKKYGVPVVAILGDEVRVYTDRSKIAEELYISKSVVDAHVKSGTPTAGGYVFRKLPHMGALNNLLGLED